jgi:hypothetical protein
LNDPDRDIKRIFPASTGYKTSFITIQERGGTLLAGQIEEKLGDRLEPTYESLDVPYAYYTVLKGRETIGHVHGVNQKGMFGGMQLILATDLGGVVIDFYYQKISSPEAKIFRDNAFTRQFVGVSLEDFYRFDFSPDEQGPIAEIKDPSKSSSDDFAATIRGIKKNLILFDSFIMNNKADTYYNQLREVKNDEQHN